MSGISNKLRAYYHFLQENPKLRKSVVLIQYAVPMKTVGESL